MDKRVGELGLDLGHAEGAGSLALSDAVPWKVALKPSSGAEKAKFQFFEQNDATSSKYGSGTISIKASPTPTAAPHVSRKKSHLFLQRPRTSCTNSWIALHQQT